MSLARARLNRKFRTPLETSLRPLIPFDQTEFFEVAIHRMQLLALCRASALSPALQSILVYEASEYNDHTLYIEKQRYLNTGSESEAPSHSNRFFDPTLPREDTER